MTTPQPTLAVAGYERDRISLASWHGPHDELCRRTSQITSPVLLPRTDERLRTRVVENRSARRREAETTAHTLGATPHRPRTRRAAPLAQRRPKTDERQAAFGADLITRPRAHRAAAREEHIEHVSIVATNPSQQRAGCVPEVARQARRENTASASASDSWEPMSYHAPGTSHV